jgi:hypothetical protein
MLSEPRDVPVTQIATWGQNGQVAAYWLTRPSEVRWGDVTEEILTARMKSGDIAPLVARDPAGPRELWPYPMELEDGVHRFCVANKLGIMVLPVQFRVPDSYAPLSWG